MIVPVAVNTSALIAGIQLVLGYDDLSLKPKTPHRTVLSSHMTLLHNVQEERLSIVMYSASLDAIPEGTGPVVNIPFEILQDTYELTHLWLESAILVDITGKPIPVTLSQPSVTLGGITPTSIALFPNYPNPFNSGTSIRYQLHQPMHVSVQVYDVLGRKVSTLVDEWRGTGFHVVSWDGKTGNGSDAPSGIYFCRMTARDVTETRRMVLMR